MLYAAIIFNALLSGIANALRGSGEIKKIYVYVISNLIFTALLYYFVPQYWYIGIVAILIDWGCNSFGWGDFFPHGKKDVDGHKGGFKPARWAADLFFDSKDSVLKWQITAMTFRFLLTFGLIIPASLISLTGDFLFLLTALPYLLSGWLYRIPFAFGENRHSLRIAEFLNGFVAHGSTRGLTLYLLCAKDMI